MGNAILKLGFLVVSPFYALLCLGIPITQYFSVLFSGAYLDVWVGILIIQNGIFFFCAWIIGAYYVGSTITKKDLLIMYHDKGYGQYRMRDIALAYIRASADKQDSQKNQDDKINNDFNEMLKALGITTEGGVK